MGSHFGSVGFVTLTELKGGENKERDHKRRRCGGDLPMMSLAALANLISMDKP